MSRRKKTLKVFAGYCAFTEVATIDGLGIAEVHAGDLSTAELHEAEANAKLIAAAPEMLAALKAIQKENPDLSGDTFAKMINAIKATE